MPVGFHRMDPSGVPQEKGRMTPKATGRLAGLPFASVGLGCRAVSSSPRHSTASLVSQAAVTQGEGSRAAPCWWAQRAKPRAPEVFLKSSKLKPNRIKLASFLDLLGTHHSIHVSNLSLSKWKYLYYTCMALYFGSTPSV